MCVVTDGGLGALCRSSTGGLGSGGRRTRYWACSFSFSCLSPPSKLPASASHACAPSPPLPLPSSGMSLEFVRALSSADLLRVCACRREEAVEEVSAHKCALCLSERRNTAATACGVRHFPLCLSASLSPSHMCLPLAFILLGLYHRVVQYQGMFIILSRLVVTSDYLLVGGVSAVSTTSTNASADSDISLLSHMYICGYCYIPPVKCFLPQQEAIALRRACALCAIRAFL